MAKVAFTKLGLSKNTEVKEIEWNGQKIEVKQYLPAEDKLELCSKIINESVDDQNFYNPGRVAIFQAIEVILAYTNINVTEKQREDPCKLFDLLHNGFAQAVYLEIPSSEIGAVTSIVEATIANIYEYKNSVMGILDAISNDYSTLLSDTTEIQNAIRDGDNIQLLKNIMTKLG